MSEAAAGDIRCAGCGKQLGLTSYFGTDNKMRCQECTFPKLTPKEAYEARKAARIEARRQHPQQTAPRYADRDEEMTDLFDRFVTAAERIADALEDRT